MKEDIRIIKHVGIITSYEGNWQKELNIVSINGGPFKYDLREWTLDHSSSRNGLSFSNEEASVLLAVLKECFKGGGEDITVEAFPRAIVADTKGQITLIDTKVDEELMQSDEPLFALLKERGIKYIDKRDKGGALWIVGGHELDDAMKACREIGYKFFYSVNGGRITKNQPGWFLRSKK